MGLFNKLTDALKDAAPIIGGVVGFGLGRSDGRVHWFWDRWTSFGTGFR